MKRFILVLMVLGLAIGAYSQTMIATVQNSQATENHNQRKIVRDYNHHVYVFYQDFVAGSWGIYQVIHDSLT